MKSGGNLLRSGFRIIKQHINSHIYFHQASGLGDLISRICKPEFILSDLPHTQLLFKKNRIQESLGLILTIWTPNMIVKKWGLDNLEFLPSKVIFL